VAIVVADVVWLIVCMTAARMLGADGHLVFLGAVACSGVAVAWHRKLRRP
jgi:hypothetical protein